MPSNLMKPITVRAGAAEGFPGAGQNCDFGTNIPGLGAFVPAGAKEQTPICPMPVLTLRRCIPSASSSCSHVRKDGCPGGGSSVLAHALKIFPIPEEGALGQLRTQSRKCRGKKNGKNVHRAGSDGGHGHGASVASRVVGRPLEEPWGNIAGALAKASDKSEFILFCADCCIQSHSFVPHPGFPPPTKPLRPLRRRLYSPNLRHNGPRPA
jgi:hypothetical protein